MSFAYKFELTVPLKSETLTVYGHDFSFTREYSNGCNTKFKVVEKFRYIQKNWKN